MKAFSFGEIDPEDLLRRLTLYAYTLFGCFPDPIFEPVLKFHGASPEDLAIATLLRLLDPDDHSVEWKASYGSMTRHSLLGFLKTVLVHDFIDMKRASNRHRVMEALAQAVRRDRAKIRILPITRLGLIEMTRERKRESLFALLGEACPQCHASGRVLSRELRGPVAADSHRDAREERGRGAEFCREAGCGQR